METDSGKNANAERGMHAVLVLTHNLFEVCDKSPLNADDQVTAAVMLLELVKGSRAGHVKVSLAALDGSSQHPDTQGRSADRT